MEVFTANASIGALVFEMNPLFLTISATLTCSMAFMLPVSTGPNAIGKKKRDGYIYTYTRDYSMKMVTHMMISLCIENI